MIESTVMNQVFLTSHCMCLETHLGQMSFSSKALSKDFRDYKECFSAVP